jgi:hypothetical protein
MPTPFTHLAAAQRFLDEPAIAEEHRELFRQHLGAFLLGNVAADARNESGTPRAATHFYDFAEKMTADMPWQTMLREHPDLWTPRDTAHEAFVAGYIAHLSMDEVWSRRMVGPYFVAGNWADRTQRWVMLHVILICMDERDEHALAPWHGQALASAAPSGWAAFLTDASLQGWRDMIAGQLLPGGRSQTLHIFGARAHRTPEQFRALLDDSAAMHDALWQHVSPDTLGQIEAEMYDHAVTQTLAYLAQARVAAR